MKLRPGVQPQWPTGRRRTCSRRSGSASDTLPRKYVITNDRWTAARRNSTAQAASLRGSDALTQAGENGAVVLDRRLED